MEIKEWLGEHPLINAYSIEKALGLPIGTIKKGRNIPEKYLEAIAGLLRGYGYKASDGGVEVVKLIEKVAEVPLGRRYVVKRVSKIGITEHAYIFGKMENGMFKRDNDIQDGSVVVI